MAGGWLDILRPFALRCKLECDGLCLEVWCSEKLKKVSIFKDRMAHSQISLTRCFRDPLTSGFCSFSI